MHVTTHTRGKARVCDQIQSQKKPKKERRRKSGDCILAAGIEKVSSLANQMRAYSEIKIIRALKPKFTYCTKKLSWLLPADTLPRRASGSHKKQHSPDHEELWQGPKVEHFRLLQGAETPHEQGCRVEENYFTLGFADTCAIYDLCVLLEPGLFFHTDRLFDRANARLLACLY